MIRLSSALVLACSFGTLSGCQSGPLARAGSDTTSDIAQAAASELDPRVARLQGNDWFSKPAREIPKEYAAAKEKLNNPEKLMTAMARYQEQVSEKQHSPQAMEIARQTYTTLLTDNPDSLTAMLGLARVDYKADRLGDAERMYKTIAAKFPQNPEALAAVADFYNQTDKPSHVMNLLPAAIQRDPENRPLRHHMGVALVKMGRVEEAIPHFTKVQGLASAYATVGQMLADQKDFAGAKQYLNRALERNPQLPGVEKALASLGSAGNMPAIQHAGATAFDSAKNRIRQASQTSLLGKIE